MAEEINETPDISEDESFVVDTRNAIIDTSFRDRNESVNSPVLKPNHSKKKAHVITSDSSNEEEEEEINISDTSLSNFLDGREAVYNSTVVQIQPNQNDALTQSYRDTLPVIASRSPSPEPNDNVVEISDEEETIESKNSTGATRNNLIIKSETFDAKNKLDNGFLMVTTTEYQRQEEKVLTINADIKKYKSTLRTINVSKLPDKGDALTKKLEHLMREEKVEEEKLNKMTIITEKEPQQLKPATWEDLEAGMGYVQPNTFGKKALQTLNIQKALTMDRLEQLHGSLKTCPTSDTLAEDPEGLKVELMPHQKHALAWLSWREKQKPSGGILADDMGLGKTLTMIALTLKIKEAEKQENAPVHHGDSNPDRKDCKYPGGTLVVCPASLLYQWESEIKRHVKKRLITTELYHGNNRENKSKRLAKYDMVITTYALVMGDNHKVGPLFKVKWRRIILDEAHQVRNHKSQTSQAVCNLAAKSRWVLTGTPIHNKELDLYALLKFLRCSPFDDIGVWKRWVTDKSTGGQDRLNMVMSSLLLRRTKQQLEENKTLTCLPEKTWKLIEVTLDEQEMSVYQKVLIFSRTLFAQFLHQRAEKNAGQLAIQQPSKNTNEEYFKMHKHLVKLNRVKEIKQHEILVLLLRLRQICCHPSLIINMLQGEDLETSDIDDHEQLNLLEQLNKLNLEDNTDVAQGLSEENQVGLAEASRGLLNPSHPIFAENRRSSKVTKVMQIIEESTSGGNKIIVISQWTKLLNLIAIQLKQDGTSYFQLDGSVPVVKRMEIVQNFNDPKNKGKVLLLSLTAGGVGLNLIGANHLILLDLHWNPQLELQAQDRIYRVGQTKPVKIYKLMAMDTIEQRIKTLQDMKLSIAEEVLTGAKIQQQNKLSLEDLKMLFNM